MFGLQLARMPVTPATARIIPTPFPAPPTPATDPATDPATNPATNPAPFSPLSPLSASHPPPLSERRASRVVVGTLSSLVTARGNRQLRWLFGLAPLAGASALATWGAVTAPGETNDDSAANLGAVWGITGAAAGLVLPVFTHLLPDLLAYGLEAWHLGGKTWGYQLARAVWQAQRAAPLTDEGMRLAVGHIDQIARACGPLASGLELAQAYARLGAAAVPGQRRPFGPVSLDQLRMVANSITSLTLRGLLNTQEVPQALATLLEAIGFAQMPEAHATQVQAVLSRHFGAREVAQAVAQQALPPQAPQAPQGPLAPDLPVVEEAVEH